MGGGKRQRQTDAKLNRLTGTNNDVRGKDSKGGSASAKSWTAKDRERKVSVPVYQRRVGRQSKPHQGTRSVNPSLAIHRAESGYRAEKRFNEANNLPTKKFKSFALRSNLAATIDSITYHVSKEIGVRATVLKSFASTFLLNGLMYLALQDTIRDGEELEDVAITYFTKKYGHRCEERMKLVNDVSFWKVICKDVGAFLCPNNHILRSGHSVPDIIHKVPQQHLRSASIGHLNALKHKQERKDTKTVQEVAVSSGVPRELRGGGRGNRIDTSKKQAGRTSRAIPGKGGRSKGGGKFGPRPPKPKPGDSPLTQSGDQPSTVSNPMWRDESNKHGRKPERSRSSKPGNPNSSDEGSGNSQSDDGDDDQESTIVEPAAREYVDELTNSFVGGGCNGLADTDAIFTLEEIQELTSELGALNGNVGKMDGS